MTARMTVESESLTLRTRQMSAITTWTTSQRALSSTQRATHPLDSTEFLPSSRCCNTHPISTINSSNTSSCNSIHHTPVVSASFTTIGFQSHDPHDHLRRNIPGTAGN